MENVAFELWRLVGNLGTGPTPSSLKLDTRRKSPVVLRDTNFTAFGRAIELCPITARGVHKTPPPILG
jgi:hypothetical protein